MWGNLLPEAHERANQTCQGGVPPSLFADNCPGDRHRHVLRCPSSLSVPLLKWLLMFCPRMCAPVMVELEGETDPLLIAMKELK